MSLHRVVVNAQQVVEYEKELHLDDVELEEFKAACRGVVVGRIGQDISMIYLDPATDAVDARWDEEYSVTIDGTEWRPGDECDDDNE